MPNGRSILAAGIWGPEKDQLASIRYVSSSRPNPSPSALPRLPPFLTTLFSLPPSAFILNSPKRLRKILSAPEFVAEFGEPKPFADKKKKPKKKKKAAAGSSDDEEEEEAEDADAPSARRRRNVFGGEDVSPALPLLSSIA